jgi:hypothetical protein
MINKRRNRMKPAASFKERLASFACNARETASRLPAGPERHDLLERARLADIAAHLDEWANSPELQPPK